MDPLFATFTKSNWDTCLTKRLPDTYTTETFRAVVEYMLNPEPDSWNRTYTPADDRLLHVATENYKRAKIDSSFGYEIAFVSQNTKRPVQVKLEDRLSKFSDCVSIKEDLLEGTGKYQEIQLLYNYKEVGGIYVPARLLSE